MSEDWIDACAANQIDQDVIRFDLDGRTYAIYRTYDSHYFMTDGLCTHEQAHLADGFVMGTIIECPKHNGRFDFRTGEAKGAPVCVNLKTYPVKVEGGKVFVKEGDKHCKFSPVEHVSMNRNEGRRPLICRFPPTSKTRIDVGTHAAKHDQVWHRLCNARAATNGVTKPACI
jgi:3-phenylpropionate/trans-cinnamate dioxygenase ferredoxin subunit